MKTDELVLYSTEGVIPPSKLGPDAVVLPTVDSLGRHTFGIWPNPSRDIDDKLLDVWCSAGQLRSIWPQVSIDRQLKRTVAAETSCRRWLAAEMRKSPRKRYQSKRQFYEDACKRFPDIGQRSSQKPSRAFDRAWAAAMMDTGTEGMWGASGRPPKSPR